MAQPLGQLAAPSMTSQLCTSPTSANVHLQCLNNYLSDPLRAVQGRVVVTILRMGVRYCREIMLPSLWNSMPRDLEEDQPRKHATYSPDKRNVL